MPRRDNSNLDEARRLFEAERQRHLDEQAEARLREDVPADAQREAARILQEAIRVTERLARDQVGRALGGSNAQAQDALVRQRQRDEEMRRRAEATPSDSAWGEWPTEQEIQDSVLRPRRIDYPGDSEFRAALRDHERHRTARLAFGYGASQELVDRVVGYDLADMEVRLAAQQVARDFSIAPPVDPEDRDAPVVVAVAAAQFAHLPVAVICSISSRWAVYRDEWIAQRAAGFLLPDLVRVTDTHHYAGRHFSRVETLHADGSDATWRLIEECKARIPVSSVPAATYSGDQVRVLVDGNLIPIPPDWIVSRGE